jgi:hypothetical protein
VERNRKAGQNPPRVVAPNEKEEEEEEERKQLIYIFNVGSLY